MHRIRVGLTGLACVFLLVMLATAFLRMAGTSETQNVTASQPTNSAAPAEPLAQLGVAPGNGPAAPAPTPKTPLPAKPAQDR